jgi:hypothetical protein
MRVSERRRDYQVQSVLNAYECTRQQIDLSYQVMCIKTHIIDHIWKGVGSLEGIAQPIPIHGVLDTIDEQAG